MIQTFLQNSLPPHPFYTEKHLFCGLFFALQNSLTAVEQVKVEQSIAEEERLLYEQSDLRIEVVELTRLAAIKSDEREQKARDYMRAELRYHRALDDLKSRDLAIIDNKKKYQEMMTRFVLN